MTMALTARTTGEPAIPAAPRPHRRARAGDLLLADALDREARAPQGRFAVVVRLSRLPPPGPRPYHRRVARALLEDCAQRHGGQVLQLASGDLVLLAHALPHAAEPPAAADTPQALPALLARLLHLDGDEAAGQVTTLVKLADGHDQLRALLDEPAHAEDDEEPAGRPRNPFAGRLSPGFPPLAPGGLAPVPAGGIAQLMRVQTTARLPPRGAPPSSPILPVHRAPAIEPGLLAAHLAAHQPSRGPEASSVPTDPWLRQHLAEALGRSLLAALQAAWGGGGPLDAAPRAGVPPLLLRLPLALIATPAFAEFAALPHGEAPPSIAIAMAEAAADPAAWAEARTRLSAAAMPLVLDGLSHHALVLARPEALGPDMLALPWSTALPRLPAARQAEVAAAIARIGPARFLMTGADGEAALRWGRASGIQQFQGAHVEAMLAATRLLACPGPGGARESGTEPASLDDHPCGLRACAGRGTAATQAGRAGCIRPDLLDRAIPPRRDRILPAAVMTRAVA
jgi:hypothetical protein